MTRDNGTPGNRSSGLDPFEAWLRVFFEDSLLWPVLGVSVLIFGTFGSAIVNVAVHDRNLMMMGLLAVLAGLSIWELDSEFRRRRFGPVGALILTLWTLSLLGGFALSYLAPT